MTVTVRHARLENGLRVILKEVHAAPVTSTWLWYRVGSRNEVEGGTGLSHWVEHMMFKGSERFPRGSIMRAVDRHGGYMNAMTSYDFTAYYETLPADRTDLALELEADRMAGATFDAAEVEAERTVIIAEREGSENEPRYMLAEEVTAAAFHVHPYHHQTVGWKEDLRHLTRDELYTHYRRYYMPNNAVLVLAGDFDADSVLGRVEEYFGPIPAGEVPPSMVRPEPVQRGERRVTLRMPGSSPILRVAYHTPPVSHPDYIPLVVLDAVLSGGKAMFAFGDSPTRSARLYRALVETQLASSAGSSYHPSLDPFLLSLGATVRLGREPAEVEEAMLAEVERLHREPVQERELQVAIRQTQAQFAYHSESVTSQALTLGFLEMVDRHERMDTVLDELAGVTPDDVLRVAREYLTEDNRTVGWFKPTIEGGAAAADVDAAAGVGQAAQLWSIPNRGMFAYHTISPETVARQRLENGITVLVKENPASSTVTFRGEIQPGGLYETESNTGLASLMAAMLRRGTRRRTFQELNTALDDVGASLSFYADADSTGTSARGLADDLDLLIDLLAEMLIEPAFPEGELEKYRGQLLTHLNILENDTGYRADLAFMEALYPAGHPYARPTLGTRETVAGLTRDDVEAFYRAYAHPATMVLSVVGAVQAERVIERLSAALGGWRVEGDAHAWAIPPAETPADIIERRITIPGKSQVDLVWGVVGMARSDPDYYPAMMGNIVMGRLGMMGRLGDSVREREGLAYYVSSSMPSGPGPQPWNVSAGVHPKDVGRTVELTLQEIARLRDEPVSAEELDDCRSFLTGALPLQIETNDGVAGLLVAIEQYGLGLDYLQRYPEIIGAVTAEEIRRVAAQYLTLDRYVLTMAGTF
jgi:zinc protease